VFAFVKQIQPIIIVRGKAMEPYSQHFISFATYKWVQLARELHYATLEKLARDKHSSLLCPFVSCKENEVLLIETLIINQRNQLHMG
jgi:hypothetical protein